MSEGFQVGFTEVRPMAEDASSKMNGHVMRWLYRLKLIEVVELHRVRLHASGINKISGVQPCVAIVLEKGIL